MRVGYSTEFKRNLIRLSRRYRHIRADVEPIIAALVAGKTPGDQVTGVGVPVYKIRIRNSDARRGKSGGYRCLYYVGSPDQIVLLTIYSKSDAADIPLRVLRQLIEDHLATREQ